MNGQISVLGHDLEALKTFIARPIPERTTFPLHLSEDEEDVAFLRDTGVLDKLEAENLLRELQFENAEVYSVSSDEGLDDLTLP